jgi:dCMP deaminase
VLLRSNSYYLGVAAAVARGSDCRRRRVGAIITVAGEIIVADFNRSESPKVSCGFGDCPRGRKTYAEQPAEAPYDDCVYKHAEVRALRTFSIISSAAGINTDYPEWVMAYGSQARMFCTEKPCPDCAVVLGLAGMQVTTWQ